MASSLRFLTETLWLQWFAAVTAMVMIFVSGLTSGWSSPYLAKFTSGNASVPATPDEISWMASFNQLGRLPGAILGAVFVHYLGSKTAIFVNGCGLLVAWILIILADSVCWILASRLIFGVTTQIAYISIPLYLGDIASPKIRGSLVSLAHSGHVLGMVVGNAMGAYLSLERFAWVSLAPSLYVVLASSWLPQSPYHLISKGRMMDAQKSIRKYNPKAEVQRELESMKEFLAASNSMTFVDRLREFNAPWNRKAGLILITLCMFTQMSGDAAAGTYSESIMIRGKVTVISPSTVPIIANSLGIMTGWAMVYLVEKWGRKISWMVSCAGLCSTMSALGTYFYLIDHGFDPTGLQWVAIIAMVSDKTFFHVGLNPVPPVLLSELFAPKIRSLAGFMFSLSSAVFASLSIYFYQYLIGHINEAFVWWIHAITMLVSMIFGSIFVKDMKGKSLREIQGILTKK